MKQYTVRYGQHIIDVCMACYGSVEGIKDLLSLNENLNIGSVLQEGDLINYDPANVVDQTALNYYYRYSVIPNSGDRGVYYKEQDEGFVPSLRIKIPSEVVNISILIGQTPLNKESQKIQIDWGDNSPLQDVFTGQEAEVITHNMNSTIDGDREIVFYMVSTKRTSQSQFEVLDTLSVDVKEIDFYNNGDILTLSLKDKKNIDNILSVSLLSELNSINLSGSMIKDITPLIKNQNLRNINIDNCGIITLQLDNFLIGMVKGYESHANCEVSMYGNEKPSGVYKAPADLQNPLNGMEAMWLLENDQDRGWRFYFDR